MKRFPDVLTLLTAFMVLFTILTWVIPAGEFERQQYKNKQVVVPGTYHAVDQHAQGVMDFLTAPIKGFVAAADIIGFGYRLVCWVVFTLLAIVFICRYAARIAADPTRSVVHDAPSKWDRTAENEALDMTGSRVAVLVLLTGTLGLLVYGVQTWGWYIEEIAGLFVGMGLLASLLGRLTAQDTVKAFTHGAADVVMAALIIGFSRGLLVIAEQGAIIDTILNSLAGLAEGLAPAVSVIVMFIFQSFLNFFVPSGSGQAALTMPLMAPLSDLLSVERQVAVLTFQFGDGISNLVIPTSGVTMGLLELAGIPYDRWFKFCFPLVLILSTVACVLLVLPVTVFHWT